MVQHILNPGSVESPGCCAAFREPVLLPGEKQLKRRNRLSFFSPFPLHISACVQSAQFNLQELSCVFLDGLKVSHGIWIGWVWHYLSGDTGNQCPEHLLCSPLPCPGAWHHSIAIKLIATEKALYPCAPCYKQEEVSLQEQG